MSNKLQEGFRKSSEQNWCSENNETVDKKKSAIEDLHRGRLGPTRTNFTRENVEKVSDVLYEYDDGERKSIRKVSATTGLP